MVAIAEEQKKENRMRRNEDRLRDLWDKNTSYYDYRGSRRRRERERVYDINHSKIFFDPLPRVMKIKTNKWDLIKLKRFCTAKETMKK